MTVLIGERYTDKLMKPLNYQGFRVMPVPDNPFVDTRLASHVDLSAIVLNNKSIVLTEHLFGNKRIVNILTSVGYRIICSENKQKATYPQDATLCACLCGDTLIHNTAITDPAITRAFNSEIIHVNQGYSNCMICAVDERSVITSDDGIASVLECAGWDVLKIEQGLVKLEGYDYGFIGGASFTINSKVYFTGRFPKAAEVSIEAFVSSRGKEAVYLTELNAFDIGGAIVI